MAAEVIEIDAATGEATARDYTPDEATARAADLARMSQAQASAEATARAAREAALAKLAALGLTVDDLAALGL